MIHRRTVDISPELGVATELLRRIKQNGHNPATSRTHASEMTRREDTCSSWRTAEPADATLTCLIDESSTNATLDQWSRHT